MTALYVILIVIAVMVVLYFLSIKPRGSKKKEHSKFTGVCTQRTS